MTKININKNTKGKYAFVTKKQSHRLARRKARMSCKIAD